MKKFQIKCADCECLPQECKKSNSVKSCPNCTWEECCCYNAIQNGNLDDYIFKTIGRKRTLLVLLQLREHKKLRNKEIAKNLGGISSSTLSSILKQLQKQGLISRKINVEFPPLAVVYLLTKNGFSLLQAIDPFLEWLRKT